MHTVLFVPLWWCSLVRICSYSFSPMTMSSTLMSSSQCLLYTSIASPEEEKCENFNNEYRYIYGFLDSALIHICCMYVFGLDTHTKDKFINQVSCDTDYDNYKNNNFLYWQVSKFRVWHMFHRFMFCSHHQWLLIDLNVNIILFWLL